MKSIEYIQIYTNIYKHIGRYTNIYKYVVYIKKTIFYIQYKKIYLLLHRQKPSRFFFKNSEELNKLDKKIHSIKTDFEKLKNCEENYDDIRK